MCANWSRCSGRASAFAPESSSTEGPFWAGITTAIAGRATPGRRRSSRKQAASIAPVFPAETTASASPSPDRAAGGDERAVRLGLDRLGRLLVHGDLLRRLDERQAARVEAGRAVEDRLDSVGCGLERARDFPRARGPRPARRRRRGSCSQGAEVRSGSISRPAYVLQFGHIRCGCFGRPHCGHEFTRGASILCVARRLSRRDFDVFFLGTAIGRRV